MATRFPLTQSNLFAAVCLGLVGILLLAVPAWGRSDADLPEELSGIPVREQFISLDADEIGTIQSVQGRLIVRHGRKFVAYAASAGDRLYVHDVLFTLDGARTRILLETGDVITLGENSRISVDDFEDNRSARRKRSVFSLLKGKAMFYAIRLFRYRTAATEVRTPTAIAGVRGTKFGVKVERAGEETASSGPIYLADASGGIWPGLLAQAPADGQVRTTVYGFDGVVDVTSTVDRTTQKVGAGENVVVGRQGAGPLNITPPGEARQFIKETEAPPPETGDQDPGDDGAGGDDGTGAAAGDEGGDDDGAGEEEGSGEDEGSGEEDAGDEDAAAEPEAGDADPTGGEDQESAILDTVQDPVLGDVDAAAADVSQDATQQTISTTVASGTQVGYFSALLTRSDSISASTPNSLADIYTNTTRKDISTNTVTGHSIVGDKSGSLTITGTAETEQGETYISEIISSAGTESNGTFKSTGTYPMDEDSNDNSSSYADSNGNEYLRWGYWTMSTWVQYTGTTYSYNVNNRAYYIEGRTTPDSAVASIAGDYEGSAYGTYFTGNGGVIMTGDFKCTINGSKGKVSNFLVDVSGKDDSNNIFSATIKEGAGNFTSGGEFNLDTGKGTWSLTNPNNSKPTVYIVEGGQPGQGTGSCTGSLYGTSGEAVGGAWAMDGQTGQHDAAVGIFTGKNVEP